MMFTMFRLPVLRLILSTERGKQHFPLDKDDSALCFFIIKVSCHILSYLAGDIDTSKSNFSSCRKNRSVRRQTERE